MTHKIRNIDGHNNVNRDKLDKVLIKLLNNAIKGNKEITVSIDELF